MTGNMDNKHRSGRPRLSTTRADNVLRRICHKNRFMTSKQLSVEWNLSTGTAASSSIVRRRLVSMGLRAHKAKKKPILSKVMKLKRLKWAKAHVNWTMEKWDSVIFSDESRFCTDCLFLSVVRAEKFYGRNASKGRLNFPHP